jgi:transposase
MMGSKERHFAALIRVSLEDLVPHDHFYRHLERTLDLSFVREFVQETYASKGRPSIDPIVFFKLQLVIFFEGIRSERQLMRHAADRLSVRWYIGVRHVTHGSIPSETERTRRRFFGSRAYLAQIRQREQQHARYPQEAAKAL